MLAFFSAVAILSCLPVSEHSWNWRSSLFQHRSSLHPCDCVLLLLSAVTFLQHDMTRHDLRPLARWVTDTTLRPKNSCPSSLEMADKFW